MRHRGDVARSDLAAHGDPAETERKLARQRRQRGLGLRAAGHRVGDEPDAMAAHRLRPRQIDHVAEQPAHRRAQDMKDIEPAGGRLLHRAFTPC
jgi:hypothetical protein